MSTDPVPRVYGTEQFELPREPPPGTVVVRVPDSGGPYWERDDAERPRRWRQSKLGDHRRMTWDEVLAAAGPVQILGSAPGGAPVSHHSTGRCPR